MPSDLIKALNEIYEHLGEYVLAKKMHEGKAREIFASEAIRRVLHRSADKYNINVAAKAVDAVAERLEVSAVAPLNDAEGAMALLLGAEVWDGNELDTEIPDWITRTCYYGDAYLLVWPRTNADGAITGADVFVHSPEYMRAFYSEENPREMRYAAMVWSERGKLRVNLYYPTVVERYISTMDTKLGDDVEDHQFEVYRDDQPEGALTADGHLINPYNRMPVFHGRTKRPYGTPLHQVAFGIQNVMNKLVATHMSTVDWYGWPYRAALSKAGTTGADLNDWGKGGRQVPGSGAPAPRSRPPAPGEIEKLHDTDALVQLEAGPVANFLDPISLYLHVLGWISATPVDALNGSGAPESADSRRAKLDSLLSKCRQVQRHLTGALAGALEMAMEILGKPGVRLEVDWKPLEKVSDTDGWLGVKAKEDAGVPNRVALTEAGYRPEEVDEWDQTLDSKLDALERIANVQIAMGQAAQLMPATAETAAALFAKFLAEVSQDGSSAAE